METGVLTRLGLSRSAAVMLTLLLERGAATARDLTQTTGVSRGAAAAGLRSLRDRGWAEAAEGEHEGTGRAGHRWSLALSPGELLSALEGEAAQRQFELLDTIRGSERMRDKLMGVPGRHPTGGLTGGPLG